MPFCEIRNVEKSYFLEDKRVDVLRGVNLTIEPGEMLSLTGASGSGKSTFLQVLGALDAPTSGSILFDGREVTHLCEAELSRFRNETIGFVFQFHHLLPELSALENVMMPALIRRMARGEAKKKASALLEAVGLTERADHKPGELSGVNSSGWRWRGRWCSLPDCCSPTNRRAISTPRRARAFTRSSGGSTRS